MNEVKELTRLLNRRGASGGSGLDELMPLIYDRIKQLALSQMRRNTPSPTLSATMLVNEAWLRLRDTEHARWQDRRHFFGAAATTIRHIIIDHLRQRAAQKRGGDDRSVNIDPGTFDGLAGLSVAGGEELIALDKALDRLTEVEPRSARVVECHFFGGYTFDETAETLNISTPTAKRDWRFARAWLKRELSR